jgi:hypothetical protein
MAGLGSRIRGPGWRSDGADGDGKRLTDWTGRRSRGGVERARWSVQLAPTGGAWGLESPPRGWSDHSARPHATQQAHTFSRSVVGGGQPPAGAFRVQSAGSGRVRCQNLSAASRACLSPHVALGREAIGAGLRKGSGKNDEAEGGAALFVGPSHGGEPCWGPLGAWAFGAGSRRSMHAEFHGRDSWSPPATCLNDGRTGYVVRDIVPGTNRGDNTPRVLAKKFQDDDAMSMSVAWSPPSSEPYLSSSLSSSSSSHLLMAGGSRSRASPLTLTDSRKNKPRNKSCSEVVSFLSARASPAAIHAVGIVRPLPSPPPTENARRQFFLECYLPYGPVPRRCSSTFRNGLMFSRLGPPTDSKIRRAFRERSSRGVMRGPGFSRDGDCVARPIAFLPLPTSGSLEVARQLMWSSVPW